MHDAISLHRELFEQITDGVTLLTPNRRLAATLRKHYANYQLIKQHDIWESPDILPVTIWIERLWKNFVAKFHSDQPTLLNGAQERFVWEKILAQSRQHHYLLQITETSELIKTAWALLKQWQANHQSSYFSGTEDYLALWDWLEQFKTVCRENNWIDPASLPDIIIEKIPQGKIDLPNKILLFGFNEISPQFNCLLETCKQAGSTIALMHTKQDRLMTKRIALPDQEAEITIAACYAKLLYEKNPTASIGCVIPTLDKNRDRVKQIFSEVFSDIKFKKEDHHPFNISAGKPLTQYPVVNAGLQLLALNQATIPTEMLGLILSSPFLGAAEEEREKRARFDGFLRQRNITQINLRQLKNEYPESLQRYIPKFATRLDRFYALIENQTKFQLCSEWSCIFNELLKILGWPGERSLISDEYQTVENWLQLFAEFATLDHISNAITYHEALQTLHKMSAKRTFQPQSPEAPIQVLGLLEAAALPFDYLWIAGMDDLSWPPQPSPHPFIPKRMQREMKMPHATAEREFSYCHDLTEQYKQCAKQVIFSYAKKSDELDLLPSPLIDELPEITEQDLQLPAFQSASQLIYQHSALEKIIDEKAPALLANEVIKGGASVLKYQAMCPFKAFAEWRLHAHELEDQKLGLRAKDRGSLLHLVLSYVWDKLKDQTNLLNMKEEDLKIIIETSIQKSLSSTKNTYQTRAQYLDLECKRLYKITRDWLEIEKTRPPFKVISQEKTADIQLKQLTLMLRVDRIDELADGRKLIIDYKTGKSDIKHWFSSRPDEPQLPLYALIDSNHTIGITFAQIIPGLHAFKGMSSDAINIPGIKSISEIKLAESLSWEKQIQNWQTVLEQLGEDFCAGDASVNPKELSKTCQWCGLKQLCRINEEMEPLDEQFVS